MQAFQEECQKDTPLGHRGALKQRSVFANLLALSRIVTTSESPLVVRRCGIHAGNQPVIVGSPVRFVHWYVLNSLCCPAQPTLKDLKFEAEEEPPDDLAI